MGMLHLSAKRHRFIVWWEDALWKTSWETIWRTCYSIWFIGWVSPYTYNCERSVPNPSIWKKSFTWIVPRIRSLRGGNLEGWRTDCRPWGVGDDGRIRNLLKKDSMRKRWYFPKKENLLFPIADGRIKTPGEDQETENIHLDTAASKSRRGSRWLSWRIRRVFSTTSWLTSGCRWSYARFSGSMSGSFIIPPSRWTQSPHCTRREKNHFLFPLKYIDVTRTTHTKFGCQVGEAHWWLLEHWWLSRLVWSLDRFHTIYSTRWKSYWRIYMVRGEINEKAAYIQARSSMARVMEVQWERTPSWRKSKSGLKKRFILTMHENYEESIFIDPEDKEFKETIKNARKKLETSVAPAMPCKIMKELWEWRIWQKQDKTCVYSGSWWIHQNAYGEFLNLPITKIILQEKVRTHCSTIIWCTNLFLCLKLWKFRQQKQQWTRNGKIGENFGVEFDKSQK